jgi:hypothetical protein
MAASAFDLRPLSIGDILDRTIRLYRRYFLHTLGIAAIPYLLLLPIAVALGPGGGGRLTARAMRNPAAAAGSSILGLVGIWLTFASMGALARSISARYLGGTPGIWASYRPVLRRTFSLLWAYFLSFLVWGGVLALGVVLPLLISTLIVTSDPGPWGLGIYALFALLILAAGVAVAVTFFRLLLVTQVIIIEDLRGPAALQRSWVLMRKNAWRAMIIFLFGIIVSVIGGFLLAFPVRLVAGLYPGVETGVVETFVDSLARVFSTPLLSIPFTLLYYDSRIRYEGFDLEVMAQNLGGAPAPGPVAPRPVPPGPRGEAETERPSDAFEPAAPAPDVHPVPSTPPAPGPPAPRTASRGTAGTFKVCPACGAQIPLVRPACPACGTRVPFGLR